MKTLLPIALFALTGIFAGGAISLRRQNAPRRAIVVVSLLGIVSAVGGALWLAGTME